MKCIRTKQLHDYDSNIIYTKQYKASTKNTHTPRHIDCMFHTDMI